MITLIDNYDSFVHNIARYFVELGASVQVIRHDAPELSQGLPENTKGLVISPGPCGPLQAGYSLPLVQRYSGRMPLLGICLGHQVLGAAFGGQIVRALRPLHGEAPPLIHNGQGIFKGLTPHFLAARYHSLIVELPPAALLEVTARSAEGEIMGLQHPTHPSFGVQFHPESILTEQGYPLLQNFLNEVHAWHSFR